MEQEQLLGSSAESNDPRPTDGAMLQPDPNSLNGNDVAPFRNKFFLATQSNHPHIVDVDDACVLSLSLSLSQTLQ